MFFHCIEIIYDCQGINLGVLRRGLLDWVVTYEAFPGMLPFVNQEPLTNVIRCMIN